jgi:hypothetical protein
MQWTNGFPQEIVEEEPSCRLARLLMVGGFLRKSLFPALVLFVGLTAQTAPLAFLAFDTKVAQPGRLPDGWRIKVTAGTPDVSVIGDGQGYVLRMRSRSASFGVERGIDIDVSRFPYLEWTWKVGELPRGGDFRHSRTDDQAAQVLIVFNDRRVLSYIWDSTAPQDMVQSASSIPLVHIYAFVCRSGAADLNQWLSERRDVAVDYQRVYGRRAVPNVKGIRLQINSQHTGTYAESYFGDVAFRTAP